MEWQIEFKLSTYIGLGWAGAGKAYIHYVCMSGWASAGTAYIDICVYVWVDGRRHSTYIHTYIHTYIYIYTYMYIYIYIAGLPLSF